MKILLIDNYDSFTYNLYHYLSSLKCKVEVYRNNKIHISRIKKNKYDKLVISPGPGNPSQAGHCLKIVKYFYKRFLFRFLGLMVRNPLKITVFYPLSYKTTSASSGRPIWVWEGLRILGGGINHLSLVIHT